MKRAFLSAALTAILLPGAAAEDLSSKHIFDGVTTTRTDAGAPVDIRLSIQSWGIKGDRRAPGAPQEIPLQGFYLAHLLSGEVTTTIGQETTRHSPGDYWAVKPGATMQVKALGDYAMLETTVVSKQ
jgi:hypothetical protein